MLDEYDAEHNAALRNLDYYDNIRIPPWASLPGWGENDFVPHSPFIDAPLSGVDGPDRSDEVIASKEQRRAHGLERLMAAINAGAKIGFSGSVK